MCSFRDRFNNVMSNIYSIDFFVFNRVPTIVDIVSKVGTIAGKDNFPYAWKYCMYL